MVKLLVLLFGVIASDMSYVQPFSMVHSMIKEMRFGLDVKGHFYHNIYIKPTNRNWETVKSEEIL